MLCADLGSVDAASRMRLNAAAEAIEVPDQAKPLLHSGRSSKIVLGSESLYDP